ncbi:CAP domain-containing protein [Bacillus carboniphilus]|uniref:CAP domain-containing protein n=1 Tax=Bacillus carboniphilus TaxID=86663 RepID=A0ABY9JVF6_9BACI|nr:CAP domain-containing protein [Bacillus carboniphilus]WLR43387.1 CAP domain-containing protein [Bacillus carboniphilus]
MLRKLFSITITMGAIVAIVGCNNTDNTTGNQMNETDNMSSEVQEMSHGKVTFDQNSFSTSIPSDKIPNSKIIGKGIYKFYYNQQGGGEKAAPTPKEAPSQPEGETGDQETETPNTDTNEETATLSDEVQQVIDLTNEERRKNGLSDLKADQELSAVAKAKSDDMQANNYFSHTSPNHGTPFEMMRSYGIDFNTAGENIAQGQPTAADVVEDWMNSEGHRKNILNGDYTHIGVGYNSNGHYWTQMFVGR